MARYCGNSTGHGIKQDAVGVKLDGIWGPVEAILVEAFGGSEVQLVYLEGGGICSIKACSFRFRGLEDEVYGLRSGIKFGGEEFQVDFLCVIEILQYEM